MDMGMATAADMEIDAGMLARDTYVHAHMCTNTIRLHTACTTLDTDGVRPLQTLQGQVNTCIIGSTRTEYRCPYPSYAVR